MSNRRRRPVTPAARYRRLQSRAKAGGVLISALIPRDLHDRVKMMGLKLRWSMSEVLREALGAWLDAHERAVLRVGGRR